MRRYVYRRPYDYRQRLAWVSVYYSVTAVPATVRSPQMFMAF